MFSRFGRFASKYKYFILAGWFILAALMAIIAPKLSNVGVTDQSQFLPEKTQSAYARNLVAAKFASSSESSSTTSLIVVYNQNGFTPQDMARAKALHDWLVSAYCPQNNK